MLLSLAEKITTTRSNFTILVRRRTSNQAAGFVSTAASLSRSSSKISISIFLGSQRYERFFFHIFFHHHQHHFFLNILLTRRLIGGHLHILQYIQQSIASLSTRDQCKICSFAAEGGHLAVLQWLLKNGCPWDLNGYYLHQESMQNCAARGGRLEVLKWLHANRFEWVEGMCASAAGAGQLAVLQWLRANGCDWDVSACAQAVAGGHLQVLRWLRANGCPWEQSVEELAREQLAYVELGSRESSKKV